MLRHSKLSLKRGSEKLEVWEGRNGRQWDKIKRKKEKKTPQSTLALYQIVQGMQIRLRYSISSLDRDFQ